MTQPKTTVRRRRKSAGAVPPAVAEWFSGAVFERRPLLFRLPHAWQIAELWALWAPDNPAARPPAGWEWLVDPSDQRHKRPAFLPQAGNA